MASRNPPALNPYLSRIIPISQSGGYAGGLRLVILILFWGLMASYQCIIRNTSFNWSDRRIYPAKRSHHMTF